MTSRFAVGAMTFWAGAAFVAAVASACGDDGAGAAASGTGGAGVGGLGSGAAGNGSGAGPAANAPCPGTTPAELMACVATDRYTSSVSTVAVVRPPDSAGWKAVQSYCADTLSALGYQVERHDYGSGINVVGTLAGTDRASETILVGAHYDHISGCAGADDNATGVAGVLEVARAFAGKSWSRSLAIACWDEEELGCVGSKAYAKRAASQGQKLVTVYNFDMIGYTDQTPSSQIPPTDLKPLFPAEYAELEANQFRATFILLMHDGGATAPAMALEKHFQAAGRPASRLTIPDNYVKTLDEVRRSDHRSFWDEGFPAIMITDTGDSRNPGYHCKKGPDDLASLDYAFAADVVRATIGSIAETIGAGTSPPPPPVMGGMGGSGGGGGIGGGDLSKECAALCKPTVTATQTDCVIAAIAQRGFPIASTFSCESASESTAACLKCGKDLGLGSAACAEIAAACIPLAKAIAERVAHELAEAARR